MTELYTHVFGPTAATRVMAIALEEDETAKKKHQQTRRRAGGGGGGEDGREKEESKSEPPPRTRAGSSLVAVVATTLTFGIACSVALLMAPASVVAAAGAPESVVAAAADYLAVRAFGVPAVCLIAVLGGAFQAARDARTPFLAVFLAGAANLVLDPLCIFTFGMGFRGAALATVVAQYASAILMAWYTFRGSRKVTFFGESASVSDSKFELALAWNFAKEVGNMMGRVLNVVAVWGATSVFAARLGVDDGAAHVLIFQIVSIISITAGALTTVGNAVASRLSASCGDEAARGAGDAICALGAGVFSTVAAVFFVFREPILGAFTTDGAVVADAELRH